MPVLQARAIDAEPVRGLRIARDPPSQRARAARPTEGAIQVRAVVRMPWLALPFVLCAYAVAYAVVLSIRVIVWSARRIAR